VGQRFQQAGLPLAASAAGSAQRLTPLPRLLAPPREPKGCLKGGAAVARKAASPQKYSPNGCASPVFLRIRFALPLFALKAVFATLQSQTH